MAGLPDHFVLVLLDSIILDNKLTEPLLTVPEYCMVLGCCTLLARVSWQASMWVIAHTHGSAGGGADTAYKAGGPCTGPE